MKKSTRALFGMALLDGVIFLGAAWMIMQTRSGAWRASDPDTAVTAITTASGGAIGLITALLAVTFVYHRQRGN